MSNSRFKFRVWDKENKCWNKEHPEKWQSTLICNMLDSGLTYDFGGLDLQRLQFDLVQSTGLYDRNGNEIWEGDIMDCPDAPRAPSGYISEAILEANLEMKQIAPSKYSLHLGVVVWDETCASFGIKQILSERVESFYPKMLKDYVVIGNKFENPELLENK